jgi:hypothetical protein
LNEPSAILELAAGGGHRDGSGKDGSTVRKMYYFSWFVSLAYSLSVS